MRFGKDDRENQTVRDLFDLFFSHMDKTTQWNVSKVVPVLLSMITLDNDGLEPAPSHALVAMVDEFASFDIINPAIAIERAAKFFADHGSSATFSPGESTLVTDSESSDDSTVPTDSFIDDSEVRDSSEFLTEETTSSSDASSANGSPHRARKRFRIE